MLEPSVTQSPIRSRWPYTLGGLGGGVFTSGVAIGLFASIYAIVAFPAVNSLGANLGADGFLANLRMLGIVSAVAVIAAALLLVPAWVGMLRDGHRTIVALIGTLAMLVVDTLIFLGFPRPALDLLPICLAVTGLGIGLLRGLPLGCRIIALGTSIMTVVFVVASHTPLDRMLPERSILVFQALLVAMGFALVIGLPKLHQVPTR